MKIKCYGARGSTPVSGQEYIKYGGNSTCITVTSNSGDLVIIDAGSGIRRLGNELLNSEHHSVSMIFTHAHWDHLLGFPFFKPLFHRQFSINIYGCPFAENKTIIELLAGTMEPPYFPVDLNTCKANIRYTEVMLSAFQIGSLQIIPIFLSHPNGGIGYKFIEDGKSFVFLTDNELGFRHKDGLDFIDYVRDCKNIDLLYHDGEYKQEEYGNRMRWGHSSTSDLIKLSLAANVKNVGIFHHNQDRSDEEIDEMVAHCQELLANANSDINCFAVAEGSEYIL